jgi:hypothetical protein
MIATRWLRPKLVNARRKGMEDQLTPTRASNCCSKGLPTNQLTASSAGQRETATSKIATAAARANLDASGWMIRRKAALLFSNQAHFYSLQMASSGEAQAAKYAARKNSAKIVALSVEAG